MAALFTIQFDKPKTTVSPVAIQQCLEPQGVRLLLAVDSGSSGLTALRPVSPAPASFADKPAPDLSTITPNGVQLHCKQGSIEFCLQPWALPAEYEFCVLLVKNILQKFAGDLLDADRRKISLKGLESNCDANWANMQASIATREFLLQMESLWQADGRVREIPGQLRSMQLGPGVFDQLKRSDEILEQAFWQLFANYQSLNSEYLNGARRGKLETGGGRTVEVVHAELGKPMAIPLNADLYCFTTPSQIIQVEAKRFRELESELLPRLAEGLIAIPRLSETEFKLLEALLASEHQDWLAKFKQSLRQEAQEARQRVAQQSAVWAVHNLWGNNCVVVSAGVLHVGRIANPALAEHQLKQMIAQGKDPAKLLDRARRMELKRLAAVSYDQKHGLLELLRDDRQSLPLDVEDLQEVKNLIAFLNNRSEFSWHIQERMQHTLGSMAPTLGILGTGGTLGLLIRFAAPEFSAAGSVILLASLFVGGVLRRIGLRHQERFVVAIPEGQTTITDKDRWAMWLRGKQRRARIANSPRPIETRLPASHFAQTH